MVLPTNPLYSSSKAALTTFGEGLRYALHGTGVKVNVVAPAQIRTEMTHIEGLAGWEKMPPPSAAAKVIEKGLLADKPLILFTSL